MARYDTYTQFDDRMLEDLDMGYVGFNNRLRPDQLPKGLLADSKNGRMNQNGEWQTRKGINNVIAPLATGGSALTLPFTLDDDLSGTASVVSNELVITFGSDHGLGTSGTKVITLFDLSGATISPATTTGNYEATITSSTTLKLTDKTYSSASGTIVIGGAQLAGTPTLSDTSVNEVYGSCIFSDPNDDTESYIMLAANTKVVAVKVSDPNVTYDLTYPTGLTVSDDVDMIQAFNKLFVFRKDGNVSFFKDLSATNINTSPQLEKVESGEFEQPTQIVCAAGEFALIENRGIVHQSDGVSEGSVISVVGDKTLSGDQTSGLTIGARFTVAKVFTGGSTQDIASASSASVSGGEYDGLYKVTCTLTSHGYHVGDPIDITEFTGGPSAANGSRFVAEVPNDNTFVFYMSGNPNMSSTTGGDVALAHGFEFYVDASKTDSHTTDGLSLTSTPVFTRKVSIDLGFTHMPAPEYGVYHQRRLAVPYRYSVSDAEDTYEDRKIFDEILLSDILDTDTYDQVYGQFRFNAGKSDFNVGMHSFSDDKLIVFNRNSIHIVLGSSSIADAAVQLLTDEVGLLARKSVVQVGNQVLFLSDNGIYGMNFIDLYNLRGNDVPLSESINKTISDIDKDNAVNSVAVYFDNKYYIALPTKTFTDGSPNSEGINNVLLIYNFLNKNWESIDNVNNVDVSGNTIGRFSFNNLLVAGKGSKRGVYVTNKEGGIHKLEEFDDGVDRVITEIGGSLKSTTVQGSATTRMFTLGSIDRKKFNNFEMHIQSGDDSPSDATISATTENLDSEPALDLTPDGSIGTTYGPFTNSEGVEESVIPSGEDVSIRGRIGNKRAYGMQIAVSSISGRPRFRSLKVAGAETFRSTSSVQ